MQQIPSLAAMQKWTLLAMQDLGGSAHNREIYERVKAILQLPDEVVDELRGDGRQTVIDHRIAWARTHLKSDGLMDNPQRSVWTLTEAGAERARALADQIADVSSAHTDPVQDVTDLANVADADAGDDGEALAGEEWKEILLARILSLSPGAFERLCQRLLRESGFVEVRITGRPGDGGIDGQGILQMARLVSFPVLFQCKRWQNAVGAGVVRDFRGAMYGRADRGLIITTSTFTAEARKEAVRDGAPPIDLIDGMSLADNLRDLNLGVKEIVVVDEAWFEQLQSWEKGAPAADAVFGTN